MPKPAKIERLGICSVTLDNMQGRTHDDDILNSVCLFCFVCLLLFFQTAAPLCTLQGKSRLSSVLVPFLTFEGVVHESAGFRLVVRYCSWPYCSSQRPVIDENEENERIFFVKFTSFASVMGTTVSTF